MFANLLTEILYFAINVVIGHPLVITYEVHKVVCLCIIWLRIVAVEINHDYVGVFCVAILTLQPCGLRLILLIFLFLLNCIDDLHLRIGPSCVLVIYRSALRRLL